MDSVILCIYDFLPVKLVKLLDGTRSVFITRARTIIRQDFKFSESIHCLNAFFQLMSGRNLIRNVISAFEGNRKYLYGKVINRNF